MPNVVNSKQFPLTGIQVVTVTASPSSVTANSTSEQSVTCTGLLATDHILSVDLKAAGTAGLALVSARAGAGVVYFNWMNTTAGNLTPAITSYDIAVYRPFQSDNNLPVEG